MGKFIMKAFKVFILIIVLLIPHVSVAECHCRKIVDYMVASAYLRVQIK